MKRKLAEQLVKATLHVRSVKSSDCPLERLKSLKEFLAKFGPQLANIDHGYFKMRLKNVDKQLDSVMQELNGIEMLMGQMKHGLNK